MNIEDIPEDVRAEMDGAGADPETFTAWMKTKTREEQEAMFGERNARRWNEGAITATELLRQTGRGMSAVRL